MRPAVALVDRPIAAQQRDTSLQQLGRRRLDQRSVPGEQRLVFPPVGRPRSHPVRAVVSQLPHRVVGPGRRTLLPSESHQQIQPWARSRSLRPPHNPPAIYQPGEPGLALWPGLWEVALPEGAELRAQPGPLQPVGHLQAADGPLEMTAGRVAGKVLGEQDRRSLHGLVRGEDHVV